MEFFHKLHERQLVTNVEICRRLVEEQHFGLLRERHGEPRTLALAAREREDRALGELLHSRSRQGLATCLAVLLGKGIPELPMRQASHAHKLHDRDVAGRLGALRQKCDLLCDLALRLLPQILAHELDAPRTRLQEARERLQKRRLARAVRPDDRGDFRAIYGGRDFMDDLRLAVAERKAACLQDFCHRLTPFEAPS